MPRGKRLLEDAPDIPLQDVWTDIKIMHNLAAERLGYPTQKPQELLERIISASSNEGQVVLDPFCGCVTAIYAAEKLKRKWIGIDITHLAISLIEKRLKDAFPGIQYEVHGTPKDMGARDLAARDKYQFQWWRFRLCDTQGGAGVHHLGAVGGSPLRTCGGPSMLPRWARSAEAVGGQPLAFRQLSVWEVSPSCRRRAHPRPGRS